MKQLALMFTLFLPLNGQATPSPFKAWSQEQKHFVRSYALLHFYTEALTQIANHADTISGDDFGQIYQSLRSEFHDSPNTVAIQNELDFLLSQVLDYKDASDRLDHPKKWLQGLAQTLRFGASTVDHLIYRYELETTRFTLPTQRKLIEAQATLDGFRNLTSPRALVVHGSFIQKIPYSKKESVRSYFVSLVNAQVQPPGAPQFNSINGSDLTEVTRSTAQYEFDLNRKVSQYVPGL